jgi:uncharacterized membrane protein
MKQNINSEDRFYQIISWVLKLGVIASTLLIILGIKLFFNHTQTGSYHNYSVPSFVFPHTFKSLSASVTKSSGLGYIVLGLLMLILTPILRVAASIILFAIKKDRPMTIVTTMVLIILLASFLLGTLVK